MTETTLCSRPSVSLKLHRKPSEILGVSWTLVYEVYFYLLFAATLKARSATVSVFATTAAILALQVAGALLPASDTASFLTSPLPLEFCFGLFLAYAYAVWNRRNRSSRRLEHRPKVVGKEPVSRGLNDRTRDSSSVKSPMELGKEPVRELL